MPSSANSAGMTSQQSAQPSAGGTNPFQLVTNLYAEKNVQGLVTSQILGANPIPTGGSVNAGQYLRCLRLIVRTVTPGAAGTPSVDGTLALFQTLDLTNVDGSEILYAMGSYSHYIRHLFGHPWLQDWQQGYDYTSSATTISGTFVLQPEIRWTAGVLANTDTRSQYRYDAVIAGASAATFGSGYTTFPTISITPVMEAWAQPDDEDLQGSSNQPTPPGMNLQIKARHQIYNLAAAGDNTILSTLTGNAIRYHALVTRNTAGVRCEGFSDPFYWQLDNRSMGKLNPDVVRQWANDFYGPYAGEMTKYTAGLTVGTATATSGFGVTPTGVYLFPRFLDPGDLAGQGWLYTANSTKEQFESATNTSQGQAPATVELITDEVYPVGDVDPSLVDI